VSDADKKIPIGLQLYSVREDCKRDLAAVLGQVAEMTYDGVEFAGYYDHSAEELRKMLDDNGLVCCGTHIRIETLLGDAFDETVAFNKTLGNRFLIVPSLPEEYRSSLDAWKNTAGVFNELAEKAAAVDMRVGYHNHSAEFEPIDGQYPWDVFFSNAREDVVMQLDTGNARHAGVDVAPFIERYPGRATTVHLKEWSDTQRSAVIGEGKVPWQTIFRLCETVGGTEWYIVEQEVYAAEPMVTVRQCIENLRAMGK